jgi:hypothetical protein
MYKDTKIMLFTTHNIKENENEFLFNTLSYVIFLFFIAYAIHDALYNLISTICLKMKNLVIEV